MYISVTNYQLTQKKKNTFLTSSLPKFVSPLKKLITLITVALNLDTISSMMLIMYLELVPEQASTSRLSVERQVRKEEKKGCELIRHKEVNDCVFE